MSRRYQRKQGPTELPPCEGPKLQRFEHYDSSIQWIERLDNYREEAAVTEGYVFRAKVEGQEYAIKVFKFFDPRSREGYSGPLIGDGAPLEFLAYYTDPFYAECRAYGQIKALVTKKKLTANAAIPCHGFLFLSQDDERALISYGIDLELDKVDMSYQEKATGGCRARAIVKDIASNNSGIGPNNLGRTLQRIKSLNRNKIYNMDIQLDNYRDGKLVDFGTSWTEPHVLLNALDDRAARGKRLNDRVRFDRMVKDEEFSNPKHVQALPKRDSIRRLRPRKKGL